MNERDLFMAAVQIEDPAQRAAYLDERCPAGTELRGRVDALLGAHEEAGSFLLRDRGDAGESGPSVIEQPGMMVGPYKLLEKIGEGGMGAVWKAQQDEPISREVVVKLIKAGMDSRQVLGRFQAERQALAIMDHPNIARVLDAGATEAGRPYFVMELVRGIPITQFCDERQYSPRQRLELFIPVCKAIQHAHQKGVIHRDVKPSNVLLADYDNRPVPKVIDFGVAKAIGPPLTEQSLDTGLGTVVGTVEYMSPEQATLNQLDIDTRSDIYSLGVLLYELLTGSTPFSRKELERAGILEMLRLIREQEPSRPSTKLSTSEGLPSLAAQRGTEPARLTQLVRGELDWIVMKALEKDRSRRYESANDLALDLQRFLADEPVHACPPSRGYRLRKFYRRHRAAVLVTVALVLTLMGGIVGTTWGALRAEEALEEVATQRGAALSAATAERLASQAAQSKEAETAAVLEFVESRIFAAARPRGQEGGLGPEVTLRAATEAALPYVEKSFTHQPLTEARVRTSLGNSFWFLGDWNKAVEQLLKARAIYLQHVGADHPDALRCGSRLGTCYYSLSRDQDALNLHTDILARRQRVLGEDHPDTIASMINLANTQVALNRHEEALILREKTLELATKRLGADHPDTFLCMSNLANSYAEAGEQRRALELREKVLEKRSAHPQLGPTHPDTLQSMNNLAVSFDYFRRHEEALKLRDKTLTLRKAALPADHPDTLNSMHNLAFSYAALGRHPESLKLREETLKLTLAKLKPEHPQVLRAKQGVALSYTALGRHEEARKLHDETLTIRRAGQPLHPDTWQNMYNLANTYGDLKRHQEALSLHQETLNLRKARFSAHHPKVLESTHGVAASLLKLGRISEALSKLDEALRLPAAEARTLADLATLRMRHFEDNYDADGCRATAVLWESRNKTDGESLFHAARLRAVTAAVLEDVEALDEADAEAVKAMEWLRKAAAAGVVTEQRLAGESDFAALRSRTDYQRLVNDLKEAKPQK